MTTAIPLKNYILGKEVVCLIISAIHDQGARARDEVS